MSSLSAYQLLARSMSLAGSMAAEGRSSSIPPHLLSWVCRTSIRAPLPKVNPGPSGGTLRPMTHPLAERLQQAEMDALDLYAVYLGERLGLYRELSDGGPATSAELAARAGIAERYAREWLEHQAVAGFLEVETSDS